VCCLSRVLVVCFGLVNSGVVCKLLLAYLPVGKCGHCVPLVGSACWLQMHQQPPFRKVPVGLHLERCDSASRGYQSYQRYHSHANSYGQQSPYSYSKSKSVTELHVHIKTMSPWGGTCLVPPPDPRAVLLKDAFPMNVSSFELVQDKKGANHDLFTYSNFCLCIASCLVTRVTIDANAPSLSFSCFKA
jgi:hypothetical protein